MVLYPIRLLLLKTDFINKCIREDTKYKYKYLKIKKKYKFIFIYIFIYIYIYKYIKCI